ncbi:uncharacterized protein YALI1_B10424g [Yarrowia lipolytica]|uniref:Uncharacterized protein n=1 Tax=Yarrowia lipolytica TaxID=4952 RepID=A0A1D8N6X5_YARLL|nr:hypothetical protein YALI1_B10424g [Yarrowia lipolytica]
MGVVFASIRLPFDYRTGNVYRDAPFEKKQPEFGAVGAETEIGEVTDATSSDTEATAEEFDYVAKEHGTPPNIIDGTYSAEVVFMADNHDPKFNACFMDTLKGLLDSGEESEKNDEENEEDLGADPAQRSKQLRYWATLLHWWSPYPEVRAVTDPFDDENQCALTWRAVLLGIIWVGVTSFVNMFFRQRTTAGHRHGQLRQLRPYIPLRTFFNATFHLSLFYNPKWSGGFGYGFLLMLVTQFMGFGLGGILRRVAVYPVMSMCPTILPTLAVFYTNNYTTWLPINDNRLYDNSGNVYDVTKILTNYLFDEQKYQNYSPPE